MSQKSDKERIEQELARYMENSDSYNARVWEAMAYSLLAGGKRVRPLLLLWTGRSLGAEEAELLPFACALEMIHTYSLIHDDLPAMDDDDYRRGRLTNHKVFGEGMSVLAGDGLLNYAFEVMGNAMLQESGAAGSEALGRKAQAMAYLARCAGPSGMIGGQAVDLLSEGKSVEPEVLEYIEFNKTSRLLSAALVGGAMLAGADEAVIGQMQAAGGATGKAFQIWDDVLDVEGSLAEMGKQPQHDSAHQKTTFISVYGLGKAKEEARKQTELALESLKGLPGVYGDQVRELVSSLVHRRN